MIPSVLRPRSLACMAKALARPRLQAGESSVVEMRAWPGDLHLRLTSAAAYASLIEVGVTDLVLRLGLGPRFAVDGWFPLVGALSLRYLHPIPAFARFRLESRVLAWDGEWFYLEHSFRYRDRDATIGDLKVQLHDRQGKLSTARILAAMGSTWEAAVSGPPPTEVYGDGARHAEARGGSR